MPCNIIEIKQPEKKKNGMQLGLCANSHGPIGRLHAWSSPVAWVAFPAGDEMRDDGDYYLLLW